MSLHLSLNDNSRKHAIYNHYDNITSNNLIMSGIINKYVTLALRWNSDK